MALAQQLVQKQTQKLIMTQDLRQSIELLPLSNLELSEKIQSELIDNPLLEEAYNPEKPTMPELYSVRETKSLEKKASERNNDVSLYDIVKMEGRNGRGDFEASDRHHRMIESSPLSKSLSDHLNEQLLLTSLSEEEVRIGEVLISMLDERGFITQSLESLSKEIQAPIYKIHKVLNQIHNFDPPGIGASSIQKTLQIQSEILYPRERMLHLLIEEHFEDLEKLDYKKISKQMKVSIEKIEEYTRLIKKLEPFPATLFISKKTEYVVPDIIVQESENEFTILINDEWIPKLEINQEYKSSIQSLRNPEEKEFIVSRMNSAQWLIRSINQRRNTLYRVMNSIIDFQIDFFREGIHKIRPLTLKDIAEKLSMHESTISRITTNKYVQTSWGIFELKWFFSSGVRSTEGGKESSKKIHEIIKNLVKEEDPNYPLSDQDIVDIMSSKGIEIARRTVAKYRKILKILPSNRRKRIKTLQE